ncbi:MAG: hypothetical protein AAGG55_16720 [Pseudomonadota bacterium]
MLQLRDTQSAMHTRQADRREYRWLFAMAVSCFLVVSVLTRFMPKGLRPLAASGEKRESCLKEARRAANAVLPYAFEW